MEAFNTKLEVYFVRNIFILIMTLYIWCAPVRAAQCAPIMHMHTCAHHARMTRVCARIVHA